MPCSVGRKRSAGLAGTGVFTLTAGLLVLLLPPHVWARSVLVRLSSAPPGLIAPDNSMDRVPRGTATAIFSGREQGYGKFMPSALILFSRIVNMACPGGAKLSPVTS